MSDNLIQNESNHSKKINHESSQAGFQINSKTLKFATIESLKKLDPRVQWRNPVMFIVYIGSWILTLSVIAMMTGLIKGNMVMTLVY